MRGNHGALGSCIMRSPAEWGIITQARKQVLLSCLVCISWSSDFSATDSFLDFIPHGRRRRADSWQVRIRSLLSSEPKVPSMNPEEGDPPCKQCSCIRNLPEGPPPLFLPRSKFSLSCSHRNLLKLPLKLLNYRNPISNILCFSQISWDLFLWENSGKSKIFPNVSNSSI